MNDTTLNEVHYTNLQIINGAQTSTAIGKYRVDANLQKVRVFTSAHENKRY